MIPISIAIVAQSSSLISFGSDTTLSFPSPGSVSSAMAEFGLLTGSKMSLHLTIQVIPCSDRAVGQITGKPSELTETENECFDTFAVVSSGAIVHCESAKRPDKLRVCVR